MAEISKALELEPFKGLRLIDRYQFGIDLSHAVASNPQLKIELPYAAHGYATPLRAIRRLGRVARNAPSKQLSPYVIARDESWPYGSIQPHNILKDNTLRPRASGIATAQNYLGTTAPAALGVANKESMEVSYWLRRAEGEDENTQSQLGFLVLNTLLTELPVTGRMIWSVTLPDDSAKAEALTRTGFTPVASPDYYELGDGCIEPRQLWQTQ